ncbi:glycerophosphodiester phosphodiesterase family protein [Pseudolysinimonas sp.]|uniref:glycerophosphodiester phosphodiesterase family protein n=1 Tax=Pseudolysinimonas sp. TaxID=2680009 RepID=UPI003F7FB7F3
MAASTSLATPVLVIGHRGASGYRPEHTRAAYELAIALGADAIEPDIVATKDGELVLRHENEISGTTDVAAHPEFAHLRTTKTIDGERLTGWFTEDFAWAELATLRARERIPELRQHSATFDGVEPMLRLRDLIDILEAAGRPMTLVAEVKHATHFASVGLPLDELVAAELARWRDPARLVVESFERGVLHRLRDRGLDARYVYLIEGRGRAADGAVPYDEEVAGDLRTLDVDGISVDGRRLLRFPDLPRRAHDAGMLAYVWTLRPENRFLPKRFRGPGSPADWGGWRAAFGAAVATGVDGVFVDHPDLGRAVVDDPAAARTL